MEVKPGIGYVDTIITEAIRPTLPMWRSMCFTPNHLTTLGMVTSGLTIYSLYHRKLGFAVTFLVLRLYFDYADGLLARKYKMTSKFGDWYDHIVDIVFTVGLFSVILFSKYPLKHKIGCTVALAIFFALFSVHMGCIEKEHIKEQKDKEETSISRLRHVCPDGSECVMRAFDNGTLYIVVILVMIVVCRHKKMSVP